ncbi:MAG: hypothetical protein ABI462_04380 [Ignavibacteria bacterium]
MTLKIIVIFLFLTGILRAQTDTSKTYFIKEFRISGVTDTLVNNNLKKKRFTYKDLNRAKFTNDIFEFKTTDNKNIYRVSPGDIRKISIRDGSYVLPAAGYSALAGFGLGFLIGSVANGKGSGHPSYNISSSTELKLGLGAGFALLFGIIGGLFGAGTPHYIDHELIKDKTSNDAEIKKIITKYSAK